MKNYKYSALMLNGKKIKGVIAANDFNDARKRLREKKVRVLELKEHTDGNLFAKRDSNKKTITLITCYGTSEQLIVIGEQKSNT